MPPKFGLHAYFQSKAWGKNKQTIANGNSIGPTPPFLCQIVYHHWLYSIPCGFKKVMLASLPSITTDLIVAPSTRSLKWSSIMPLSNQSSKPFTFRYGLNTSVKSMDSTTRGGFPFHSLRSELRTFSMSAVTLKPHQAQEG